MTFIFLFQKDLMFTWCRPQTWTSMESAQCRSPTRTSTFGTSIMPESSWSCGRSTPWGDTAETRPGSHLSLEGVWMTFDSSWECFCLTGGFHPKSNSPDSAALDIDSLIHVSAQHLTYVFPCRLPLSSTLTVQSTTTRTWVTWVYWKTIEAVIA